MMTESLPAEVNLLVDEGVCMGKGTNFIISFIHFFFLKYGLGEKHARLHAANCVGQNQNNYVL